ncbi:hypothetical protein BDZ89DRAFT_1076715 [Hymenopellis radicata]|nr:hypothetical protein BDZ89DRAFT_1076715 [Hymenopellis radicata]
MSTEARRLASLLLARLPPPPLKPTSIYDPSLTSQIDALSDPPSVRSALHLLNDDTTRAHELAQSDDGNLTSCYVHQQLHRREGDYWNSKWWLGIGMRAPHPVLNRIHGGVAAGKQFVDLCEAVGSGQSADGKLEQWEELTATLEYALDFGSK